MSDERKEGESEALRPGSSALVDHSDPTYQIAFPFRLAPPEGPSVEEIRAIRLHRPSPNGLRFAYALLTVGEPHPLEDLDRLTSRQLEDEIRKTNRLIETTEDGSAAQTVLFLRLSAQRSVQAAAMRGEQIGIARGMEALTAAVNEHERATANQQRQLAELREALAKAQSAPPPPDLSDKLRAAEEAKLHAERIAQLADRQTELEKRQGETQAQRADEAIRERDAMKAERAEEKKAAEDAAAAAAKDKRDDARAKKANRTLIVATIIAGAFAVLAGSWAAYATWYLGPRPEKPPTVSK
jgi:hypothetical protein